MAELRQRHTELAEGLAIDKLRLDDELIGQPECYYHTSELVIAATSYRDEAKALMDRVAGETDAAIRHNASVASDKLTEPQIKAMIATDEGYLAATQVYNEWRLLTARAAGLLASFESRGKILGKLVDLHGQNYFGQLTGGAARRDARDRVAADVRRQTDL